MNTVFYTHTHSTAVNVHRYAGARCAARFHPSTNTGGSLGAVKTCSTVSNGAPNGRLNGATANRTTRRHPSFVFAHRVIYCIVAVN